MKRLSITLVSTVSLGLLFYGNPKIENYDQFLNQKIVEDASQNGRFVSMMDVLLSGFATNSIIRRTVRKDYKFFSLYDTPVGNEHILAVGVMNQFYFVETPQDSDKD
ncbi:MAG: hypothetical protein ACU836_00945 [Gammaproteobacteria bacterium]